MTLRDFINTVSLPPEFELVVNGIIGNDFMVDAEVLDEEVTNWTIVRNMIIVFTTATLIELEDEVDSFDDDEVIPVDIDKIIE